MGAPGQQMREPDRRPNMGPDMGQPMGSDIQRRGFQEGMEGARKDMDNHRRPNVNNRDESAVRTFRASFAMSTVKPSGAAMSGAYLSSWADQTTAKASDWGRIREITTNTGAGSGLGFL